MGFIIIPIFFLSGALFPIVRLPPWLRMLSYLDPLTYGVDGLRGALIGAEMSHFPIWFDLLVVGGFLALTIGIGSYLFSKAT
jgi:ABC-2 type transport system permease protein